jgi:hypothetical protein
MNMKLLNSVVLGAIDEFLASRHMIRHGLSNMARREKSVVSGRCWVRSKDSNEVAVYVLF